MENITIFISPQFEFIGKINQTRKRAYMDIIFIENLNTYGILGIHPHEQRKPQPIRISARVTTDISRAAENDDILQSINYSTLAKQIAEFVDTTHFFTIEALIENLTKQILQDRRINSVWLRIEKPNAVPNADTVGVEITRQQKY
jgi:FolB domain-containing protein